MSFKRYIKDRSLGVIYLATILIIVNLIMMASTTMSGSIYDIAYANILIIVATLYFTIAGYLKWKSNYREIKNAVDDKKDIDMLVPQGSNLESELIRDVVNIKNNELSTKTRQLQDQLDDITDYITKWVHQIKIPISACELIADRIAESGQETYAAGTSDDIKHEMERIKFLVNQILYASRASSYAEDLLVNEISLGPLVKGVVKRNASFFISKNIELELGELDFNVITDEKWMSYILEQILNNACKYVDNGGRVKAYAVEDKKAVKLIIRDNGVGIAPSDINRVFDRGFTGNNGRKLPKSTGMGLYISKKMANKLGHDIRVSSQPGNFTEFTIIFYKLSDYFNVTKM